MLLNKIEQDETERSINWQRLQDLCLRRGWDLGQLAKEAGVSRTTLYHWQTQKTIRPRLSTVFKLAAALQVQPRELTDAAGDASVEETPAASPLSSGRACSARLLRLIGRRIRMWKN